MTPTDSSSAAENSIYNSRQHSDADDILLEEGLSSPVLRGLLCSMDVSKLLVALTAPLLTTSASTSTKHASTGVSGEVDGIDESAAQGCVDGRREQQEKQQHQTATHPQFSLTSSAVNHRATAGGSDGDTATSLLGTNNGSNKSVCDGAPVSTAGATAAGVLSLQCESGRNVLAVPSISTSSQLQHGGVVTPQQDTTEVHQITRRRRDSPPETEDEPECRTAEEIRSGKGSERGFIDVAGRITRCGGVQPRHSAESAALRDTMTPQKVKAPTGDTSAAETKTGRNLCDVLFENAQLQNRLKRLYYDTAKGKGVGGQNEEKMPPSVFSSERTAQHSPQQSRRPCGRQPAASENDDKDAQQDTIHKEREHLHQGTQRQADGKEYRGNAPLQDCERHTTGAAAQPSGLAEADAGERKVDNFPDKQESASAASSFLHPEGQLLLDKLAQLRIAKCQSDDSTGSPSKRTSFEDAAENACGTEIHADGVKTHHTLQQRTLQELEQSLLEHISAKEEVDGHIEDELKKSVAAVLAAALRGRETNPGRDACNTVYPLSSGLHQQRTQCFTTSSFDTAASSQSQSPLNLQKDEAPESTAGDSTHITGFISTCSPPSNKSDDSDSLFSVPLGTASERASTSPAKSNTSTSSTRSAVDRSNTLHTRAESENKLADCSHSASGNRSDSDSSDTRSTGSAPCTRNAQKKNSALDESSESGNSSGPDSPSAVSSGLFHTRAASDSSSSSGVSRAVDISSGFSDSTTSSNGVRTTDSGVTALTRLPSKSASVVPNICRAIQDGTGSRSLTDWTSAVVGAAVLEDCVQSVMDLEQHAARVLLLAPTDAGGAANQAVLPSLLLQKPTLSGEGQRIDCGSWGGKREKEPQSTTRTAEETASFPAASTLGLYSSSGLGDAAAGGVRKDLTGALMLASLPDGNTDTTAATAHAYRLLQQHLAATALSTGGADILGGGPLPQNNLVTAGNAGAATPAGLLEQSLSQVWMLQQQSSGVGAPLSPPAPSSFQQPSTMALSYPWAPPAPTSNIAPVSRGPVASAVAAAALLPRSFRSRSDYLSLCSLQGCSATQENERKPRTLEELRQLPSEEHIILQEMHLLAESLVRDFMKLHHSARCLPASSRGSSRAAQRGSARKNGHQNSAGNGSSGVLQRAEPLVLHYRRDNLSFSVTPASAFTPYPPSVFEGTTTVNGFLKSDGSSSLGVSHRSSMDEMEEEKKETLLGTRFFTSSDPNLAGTCSSSASAERSSGRRGAASREKSRNTHPSMADDGEGYCPPLATTHFFKARCQQAGTETGISDSTIGAVQRAFTDATVSFFREVQRQNERAGFYSDGTKRLNAEEQERKQQRTCSGGKGTAVESRINTETVNMSASTVRSLDTVVRGYQRLVLDTTNGASWRRELVN